MHPREKTQKRSVMIFGVYLWLILNTKTAYKNLNNKTKSRQNRKEKKRKENPGEIAKSGNRKV